MHPTARHGVLVHRNPDFHVVRNMRRHWIAHDATLHAAILPLTRSQAILLSLRHAAQGIEPTLEIPRSAGRAGESETDCALRLLVETTGIRACPERLRPLGHVRPESALIATRIALFEADCDGLLFARSGTGPSHDVVLLPRRQLLKQVRASSIEDAITLACIARHLLLRLRA